MKKKKQSKSLKKIAALAIALALVLGLMLKGKPESYIKARSIKLIKDHVGQCSAEQVRAPSGKDYVLTAAHCNILNDNGHIKAITEDKKEYDLIIIEEDPNSDLLLLTAIPNLKGLDIANSVSNGEHVRTFTHGSGMDTYMTEGQIIMETEVKIPAFTIENKADTLRCQAYAKYSIETSIFSLLGMGGPSCMLSVTETAMTARVAPGSSGGIVVDDRGNLIGVVSASDSDGMFGFAVTLKDCQNFLSNK